MANLEFQHELWQAFFSTSILLVISTRNQQEMDTAEEERLNVEILSNHSNFKLFLGLALCLLITMC